MGTVSPLSPRVMGQDSKQGVQAKATGSLLPARSLRAPSMNGETSLNHLTGLKGASLQSLSCCQKTRTGILHNRRGVATLSLRSPSQAILGRCSHPHLMTLPLKPSFSLAPVPPLVPQHALSKPRKQALRFANRLHS